MEAHRFPTHTLAEISSGGADLVDEVVTIAGHAEAACGRGGVCFLMLRDGTGYLQVFLKKDGMDEDTFLAMHKAYLVNLQQVTGIVAQKRPLRFQKENLHPLLSMKSLPIVHKSCLQHRHRSH